VAKAGRRLRVAADKPIVDSVRPPEVGTTFAPLKERGERRPRAVRHIYDEIAEIAAQFPCSSPPNPPRPW
jgi:hypothetical protein